MPSAPDSVINGLRKEFSNIANLKLAADAGNPRNGQFIDHLMQEITQFISQASQATLQPQGGPPGGPGGGQPGPGNSGGPPSGPPPMGTMGPGSPAGPSAVSANPDSMDEIRRMLTATANP